MMNGAIHLILKTKKIHLLKIYKIRYPLTKKPLSSLVYHIIYLLEGRSYAEYESNYETDAKYAKRNDEIPGRAGRKDF